MFDRRSCCLGLILLFTTAAMAQFGPGNPQALPGAQVGTFYSSSAFSSGCPFQCANYIVSDGSLPPGLTLDSSTGLLSGFPTTVGVYSFGLQARLLTVENGIMLAFYRVSVSPAASVGTPISPTGLLLMTAGLVRVGVFGIRRVRFLG
jgi:hypothetical protein